MHFQTATEHPKSIVVDLLIVPLFEGERKFEAKIKELDAALGGLIADVIARNDFSGKNGECVLAYTHGKIPTPRLLLLGLGKKKEYTLATFAKAMTTAVPHLKKKTLTNIALLLPVVIPAKSNTQLLAQTVAESLLLGSYRFMEYKKTPDESEQHHVPNTIHLVLQRSSDRIAVQRGLNIGSIIGAAVNYTRDLANHPGNVMTPAKLADAAIELAKTHKLKCTILEKVDLHKLGMGALLAVNQGSALPPKFIILEYHGHKTGQPVVLVGKGITFDSGGISLKPSKSMEEMKFDMAGAATVLGSIKAAAELKLPVKFIGLIPATENLPSGSAAKPGDIATAMSGKTIEIVNTDAEGRMILADALAYAVRYKPKVVIDFATLTGAMVVALGPGLTGAFSNKPELMEKLKRAATTAGEPVWPFPLPEQYKQHIKSHIADIKNVGLEGQGGAITAALFLQEFVSYPWIHLDIAGTAWTTTGEPLNPKGATGVGVRLMMEFLK